MRSSASSGRDSEQAEFADGGGHFGKHAWTPLCFLIFIDWKL